MAITVADLATQCHRLLSATPGPEGRARVAEMLSKVLADPANVKTLITPETGERDLLYQDPELGFCIFAHQYKEPKQSLPHDHGPSWARERREHVNGHWFGSTNIPLSVLTTQIKQLVPDQHFPIHLLDWQDTPAKAAAKLLSGLGYTKIFNHHSSRYLTHKACQTVCYSQTWMHLKAQARQHCYIARDAHVPSSAPVL